MLALSLFSGGAEPYGFYYKLLTPEQYVELYDMYNRTRQALDAIGVKWTACCGTVLSAVRHGEQMAWDDDMDIAATSAGCKRIYDSAAILHRHGLRLDKTELAVSAGTLYKFRNVYNSKPWPFIDLFELVPSPRGYEITSDGKDYMTRAEFGDTIEVPWTFGGRIKVPKSYMGYLDRTYGPDWSTTAYLQRWCHRTETAVDCDNKTPFPANETHRKYRGTYNK